MLLNSKGVFQFEKQNGNWRKLDSKFGKSVKRIVDEIRKIIVGDFGDSYEVKKIADSVELIPKNSSAKNFISKIKITLKQGTQIPTIIEFVEVSGDRTVMKVAKISQDPKLDESVFDETKIGDFVCPIK
jgi:outer membrane lipoprotein-sorting protein